MRKNIFLDDVEINDVEGRPENEDDHLYQFKYNNHYLSTNQFAVQEADEVENEIPNDFAINVQVRSLGKQIHISDELIFGLKRDH